jgi:hypothetical protein
MSPMQMRQRVQAMLAGGGLIANAYGGDLTAAKSSRTSQDSLTFVWRKSVWLCTGAPVELVGGVTFGILFALPTRGWSLIAIAGIWQGVDEDLASNRMSVRFDSVDLGNGWARGKCTIESLGMRTTAHTLKKSLWAELDREFSGARALSTPAPSWAD